MKVGKYRYVVALLLFIAGAINYMDRAALGVVAPMLNTELHLSPSQLGLIFSSFFFGYSIFAFVGGHLADKYGPHRVFTWAMGGWSIVCGLTAAATGFASLLVIRTLFGFGEGPMNSTTNRAISNWFPREETATMVGFTFSGQTVGSAIAGPLVGLVAIAFGWRTSFIIVAVLGFLWIVAWLFWATDRPADNKRVGNAELDLIQISRGTASQSSGGAAVDASKPKTPLRPYLFRASTLALGAGVFAVNYTLFVFISWMPSYFTNSLHLSLRDMSLVSVIPWLCGGVGYFGGGLVADFVFRHSRNKLRARKICAMVPLAISGLALVGVGQVTSVPVTVALVACAVLFLTAASQACWATIHELIPGYHVGGVGGFIHLIANTSGMIGPALMGFAVQYLGGYESGFLVGAAIDLAGVLAMFFFIRTSLHSGTPAVESSVA